MSTLCRRARGYYVSLYDLLWTTLDEILMCDDITYIALGTVLFIVILFASLVHLLKNKEDEVFSSTNEMIPEPISKRIGHEYEMNDLKRLNSKELLIELHNMTSRCNETYYASKCIRLLRDCPYLMNVCIERGGLTPFQRVCYNGHTCLVEYMLMKGADPLLETQSGENALCLAIGYCIRHPEKNLSCLDVLFQSGCKLDSSRPWFHVVLKMATKIQHKALVKWLLFHGQSTFHNSNFRSVSVPAAFPDNRGSHYRQPTAAVG